MAFPLAIGFVGALARISGAGLRRGGLIERTMNHLTPAKHKTQHSPLPWIHLGGDRVIYTRLNDGCRGLPVAQVFTIAPQDHANAQFIVTAVNHHAQLVAALESLAAEIATLTKAIIYLTQWSRKGANVSA